MSKEQDQVFFRNFSLIVGVLAVMMVVFIIVARIVGIDEEADLERRANAVSERTAPMGVISVEGDVEETTENMAMEDEEVIMDSGMEIAVTNTEAAASDSDTAANDGKAIFDMSCTLCHGSGMPGAPQLGDVAAWAPRIEKGNETLYKSAIEGFVGSGGMMPPRGANPDLSDNAIKAAVDYMIANSQ